MGILNNIKLPDLNISIFPSTKSSLGIQINSEFAKIAVLKRKGHALELSLMPFKINLPESEEESAKIIQEELEKREIKVSEVVAGLSPSSLLFKTLKLPKVNQKEIIDAIEYNIKEDLDTLKGSAYYDYDIIGEEEGVLEILVVIAKMQDIDRILNIANIAGLEIDIIDANPLSLINLAFLFQERKGEKEENICIIHFDENESYLVFYHKNIVIQTLNFDSEKYENLNPDEKEAAVESLINEINYFFLTIHEPQNIYLSGNSFKFPEIREYMQLKFGKRFNLENLDPTEALSFDYEGNIPLGIFNVPIGLAYRGLMK